MEVLEEEDAELKDWENLWENLWEVEGIWKILEDHLMMFEICNKHRSQLGIIYIYILV